VFYLHGLGAYTGAHAGEFARALCRLGPYQVFAPDLPGFGRSAAVEAADYTPRRLVDRLVHEVLRGVAAPVHVVGHSYGADLGCYLAARRPDLVRTLSLLDGGHRNWAPVDAGTALADARRFDSDHHFDSADAFLAAIRRRRRRWTPFLERVSRLAMVRLDGRYAARQRPETFAAIRVGGGADPVERTWGRLDGPRVLLALPGADLSAGDAIRAAVPRLTVVAVANCSHFMIEDAGPRLAPLLARWWATCA
jgi:pimeloyl-ACP methyl ester carboxylesterase